MGRDPRVRRGILMCAPADPASVALLVPLMNDRDPDVRAATCQALGRCREVSAIPALVEHFGRGTVEPARICFKDISCEKRQQCSSLLGFPTQRDIGHYKAARLKLKRSAWVRATISLDGNNFKFWRCQRRAS